MGRVRPEENLVWSIDLSSLVGRKILVETDDGHYRTGVLTEIIWRPIKVLGMDWDSPTALKLDLDESDTIPWLIVKSITLA